MSWWIRLLPGGLYNWISDRPEFAKVLDNVGWLIADKILRLGLTVAVGVWLARYLGPKDFGEFSYALALVSLIGSVAGMGINGIVVRDIVREPQTTRTVIATGSLLQLIGGGCAFVVVVLLALWVRPIASDSFFLLVILGLTLLFKASETVKYWLEATVQSRYAVWTENMGLLVGAGIRILLIWCGAGLLAFAWITLFESAVIACGLILVMRHLGVGFSIRWASIAGAGQMLREAWPLLLASLTVTLYMRLDVLMLDHMVGSGEVGIYAAATRISEGLYLVPMVLVSSVSPSIIRCYKANPALYATRMQQLYFAMVWMAVIATFPVALLAGSLVKGVYGLEYESAGPVLAIHLWASIAVFLGVASSQHLVVDGKQIFSLWRTLIGLLCNVLLNLFLIPAMGAKGAALATVISYYLATYSLIFFTATRAHALQMMVAPFLNPRYLLRKP